MRNFIGVALALACAGCAGAGGAFTDTAPPKYAVIPPDIAAIAAKVDVVSDIRPGDREIGPVTASTCQKLAGDPIPTKEYALALIKRDAAARGANALTNVSLDEGGANLIGNCWLTSSASATAILRSR